VLVAHGELANSGSDGVNQETAADDDDDAEPVATN